jgi:hypothetical protein
MSVKIVLFPAPHFAGRAGLDMVKAQKVQYPVNGQSPDLLFGGDVVFLGLAPGPGQGDINVAQFL